MLLAGQGWKQWKRIALKPQCESCGETALGLELLRGYLHLLQIPMIPWRRRYRLRCSHCEAITELGETIDPSLLRPTDDKKLKRLCKLGKSKLRAPLFCQAGLLVALFLVKVVEDPHNRDLLALRRAPKVVAQLLDRGLPESLVVVKQREEKERPWCVCYLKACDAESFTLQLSYKNHATRGQAREWAKEHALEEHVSGFDPQAYPISREYLEELAIVAFFPI